MQPYFHRTFCAFSTYPYSYFIRGRFVNFSTCRNKSLHTQGHLSFAGKNGRSTAASFQVFFCQYVYKLTIWNVIDILAHLLSAVLIAVVFHHLATKSSSYFACFYLYLVIFSRRGYCRLAAIVFAAWVAMPFFASLRHF